MKRNKARQFNNNAGSEFRSVGWVQGPGPEVGSGYSEDLDSNPDPSIIFLDSDPIGLKKQDPDP